MAQTAPFFQQKRSDGRERPVVAMIRADFHTPPCYDHARGTPAEMAAEALRTGMTALGMGGHARMEFFCDYAMTPEGERRFFAEMQALKAQYAGRLDLFCGVELDYYSLPADLPYDYRIGSVHYIKSEGHVISVDSDPEELVEDVRRCGGGDFKRLYQIYYETVADILNKTGADIVGHIDLISKFNEDGRLFSMEDPAYRRAALDAVDALLAKDPLFEINSGAISRGCRTTPYPLPWILKEIHDRGGRILLSSDAHEVGTMLFRFGQSAELAKAAGFRTAWTLTGDGFQEHPL